MMIRGAVYVFTVMSLVACSGCLAPVSESGTVDSGARDSGAGDSGAGDSGAGDSGAVQVVDGGSASCRGYQWRGASMTGPLPDSRVLIRQLSRFGTDWFEVPLDGSYNLVGSRGAGLTDWRSERALAPVRGLEIILPVARGTVIVSEFGIGIGCRILSRSQALVGPFGAERVEVTDSWELLVMDVNGETVLRF